MSQAATYRYGNKNNWRRWAWNRIAEHCPVPKSEARVLYMPGPEDNDRDLAKRHGFKDWNLIGVDLCRQVVSKHRAMGKVMVRLDAVDAAYHGRSDFDVFFLDFLGDAPGRLIEAMVAMPGGVLCCLNMLRGRTGPKTKSNPFWTIARTSMAMDEAKWGAEFGGPSSDWKLHRGMMLNTSVFAAWTSGAIYRYGLNAQEIFQSGLLPGNLAAELYSRWDVRDFRSYRSQNGLIYDSIVFRVRDGAPEVVRNPLWDAEALVPRRLIAAAKALSTMQRRPSG